MKKVLVWMLTLLLVLSTAACACTTKENSGDNPPSGAEVVSPTEDIPEQTIDLHTPAATDAPASETTVTLPPEESTPEPETNTPEPEANTPEPDATAKPFDGTVLVDNKECLVRVTGTERDAQIGYCVNVYLENRSSDKTYNFAVPQGAVNGVTWDPYFFTTVAPGKSKNDRICFTDPKLAELIGEFTDIELLLSVYDHNGSASDEIVNDVYHIYPLGKDKVKTYERDPQPNDHVIVDNDRISVILTEANPNGYHGYTLYFFLVNKTSSAVTLTVEDPQVNGKACDPSWSRTLGANKCGYTSMYWSQNTFSQSGVSSDVSEIAFVLRGYETNSTSLKDFYQEKITIHP